MFQRVCLCYAFYTEKNGIVIYYYHFYSLQGIKTRVYLVFVLCRLLFFHFMA